MHNDRTIELRMTKGYFVAETTRIMNKNGAFEMPVQEAPSSAKLKVNVPVDLEQEKNDSKSVNAGSSS